MNKDARFEMHGSKSWLQQHYDESEYVRRLYADSLCYDRVGELARALIAQHTLYEYAVTENQKLWDRLQHEGT